MKTRKVRVVIVRRVIDVLWFGAHVSGMYPRFRVIIRITPRRGTPAMSRDTAVVLFARLPVPGKAKTRLAKDVGPDAAADLYRRMAERAFAATASSSRAASRTLCFSEASEAEGIQPAWCERYEVSQLIAVLIRAHDASQHVQHEPHEQHPPGGGVERT